ncbi:hypothetical protein GGR52DRAFT_577341 [Hypoxylon sp. FL1284]|nr:hypothetical protein GGR52DRAFT_577341 [Hypoxylon sp. FL1284]
MKMLFVAGAFLAALVSQGSAQGLNACASGCVNGVFVNSGSMGCAINDRLCVCGKSADFDAGIRDCINQGCKDDAAAQLPLAQSFGADQCKTASSAAGLLPAATPATSPSPSPTQATEATQQTPASTPTTKAAETNATPATSPGPSSTSTADATASGSASIAAAATSSESSSSSESASSTTGGDASTSNGTSSAEKSGDSAPMAQSSMRDGLSVGARAGIGAGVGVAAVLLGIFVAWLLMRRRKQARQARSMQISQPLPGSGRQYASNMRQTEAGLSKNFAAAPVAQRAQQSRSPSPRSPSAASRHHDILSTASIRLPFTSPRPGILDGISLWFFKW